MSSSSSTSSNSSSKKDLFGTGAGGLAANLFERIDKLRKQNASSSSSSSTASASSNNNNNNTNNDSNLETNNQTSSSSTKESKDNTSTTSTANLISNLAISFHKNLTQSSSSPSSSSSASLSSLTSKQKQESTLTNLVLVDDDTNLDTDDNLNKQQPQPQQPLSPTKSQIPISQSDSDFNKKSKLSNQKSNSSQLNNSSMESEDKLTNLNDSSTTQKLSSSSSLYKLSSVIDDIKSDLAKNPTLNSVVDEADALRRKFFIKKKSIESSFENIKIRSSKPTTSSSSAVSTSTSTIKTVNNTTTTTTAAALKTPTASAPTTPMCGPTIPIVQTKLKSADNESNKTYERSESTATTNSIESISRIYDNSANNDLASSFAKLETEQTRKTSINLSNNNNNNQRQTSFSNQKDNKLINLKRKSNVTFSFNTLVLYKHITLPLAISAFIYFMLIPASWTLLFLTYSSGFISGILISIGVVYLMVKLDLVDYLKLINGKSGGNNLAKTNNETSPNETNTQGTNANVMKDETIEQIHSLLIQTALFKENRNFDGVYKGWMNELREVYDPDNYFLNKTRSVYLNLDGCMLRLQTTTSKIPKRAICGETIAKVTFNEQRIYDLSDSEIFILPKELVRKRYWSKKYPICLKNVKLLSTKAASVSAGSNSNDNKSQQQQQQSQNSNISSSSSSTSTSSTSLSTSPTSATTPSLTLNQVASNINRSLNLVSSNDEVPNENSNETTSINPVVQLLDSNTLILFGRSDREKEEWFKLFKKSASKKLTDSNHYLKLKRTKSYLKENSNNINVVSPESVKLNDSNLVFSYNASNDKIIYKLVNDIKNDSTGTAESNTTSTDYSAAAAGAGASSSSSNNASSTTTSFVTNNSSSASQNESGNSGSSSNSSGNSQLLANSDTQTENALLYDSSLTFMNTFLIRLFADFFTHKYWISKIQTKIQNKLNTIKVPYFMEELRVTDLDLGSVVPLIKQVSEPWYDDKGLWVHLDIDYTGGIQILLSTKLNLMKLKSSNPAPSNNSPSSSLSSSSMFAFKNNTNDPIDEPTLSIIPNDTSNETTNNEQSTNTNQQTPSSPLGSSSSSSSNDLKSTHFNFNATTTTTKKKKHLGITNSDEEDSPESSGDEYVHTGFNNDEDNKLVETANTGKKFLNIVNKIAASNYFQKATENKYIKMAMENVSNCQLLLNVELRKLVGTVALNIPPHPSDRIWYGFITNPQINLVAIPQVGDKEVSYAAISDWIADKLKTEFQKVLVFPNMDDFYIPILNSEVEYNNW